MLKVIVLYLLAVGSISAILYGIPVTRGVAKIHKRKLALSAGVGFLIVIFIFLGEQIQ